MLLAFRVLFMIVIVTPGVVCVVVVFFALGLVHVVFALLMIVIARVEVSKHFCQTALRRSGQGHDVFGHQHRADRGFDRVLVRVSACLVFKPDNVHARRVQVHLDDAVLNGQFQRTDAVNMGVHFAGFLRQKRRGGDRRQKRQVDGLHGDSFPRVVNSDVSGQCNAGSTSQEHEGSVVVTVDRIMMECPLC